MNEAMPLQQFSDRARSRPVFERLVLHQAIVNQLRTVLGISALQSENSLLDLFANAEGMLEDRMGAILESSLSKFSKPFENLVSGLLADTEFRTYISDCPSAIGAGSDKTLSF